MASWEGGLDRQVHGNLSKLWKLELHYKFSVTRRVEYNRRFNPPRIARHGLVVSCGCFGLSFEVETILIVEIIYYKIIFRKDGWAEFTV